MRISDWSSDVCSSDLRPLDEGRKGELLSDQPPDRIRHSYAATIRMRAGLAEFRDRQPAGPDALAQPARHHCAARSGKGRVLMADHAGNADLHLTGCPPARRYEFGTASWRKGCGRYV